MTADFVCLANFLKTSAKWTSAPLTSEKNKLFETKVVSNNYQKSKMSDTFVKKTKGLY